MFNKIIKMLLSWGEEDTFAKHYIKPSEWTPETPEEVVPLALNFGDWAEEMPEIVDEIPGGRLVSIMVTLGKYGDGRTCRFKNTENVYTIAERVCVILEGLNIRFTNVKVSDKFDEVIISGK